MGAGANNNESQSYTNSINNISLNNGYLYIRAKKDNPFNPNQPGYTSGRINTKDKAEQQYGLWEIRAKLPQGTGTWPAIWMLNSNITSIGWPNCGEIDILEHVGYDPDNAFFSIHNANLYGNVGGTNQQGIYYLNGLETDFHTYSVEWDSTRIRGFVDGNLYFNYNKSIDYGLTFSEKTQINSVNGHVVAYAGAGPRIRTYGDNLYIIWADSRNGYSNTSIFMNQSNDNGTNWIDDFMVSDQPYFQLYSEIEIDDSGFLHLVYFNYGSSMEFLNIRYGKLDLNGMILDESIHLGVTSEEAEPCDCCAPDLEVTGNGDVYIAYRNNISNIRDHYITRKMDGESEFSEPVPIAVLNDVIGFCPSSSPSIYIDGDQIGVGFMNYSDSGVYLSKGSTENLQFENLQHVFQLFLTNSTKMYERGFINEIPLNNKSLLNKTFNAMKLMLPFIKLYNSKFNL